MSWWLCGTLWSATKKVASSNSPLNCNWVFCESHVGKTLMKSNVRSWRFRALVLESADTDGPKKRGPVVRSDRQHEELQQSTWIMQKWRCHNLICLYWHIESQLQTSWFYPRLWKLRNVDYLKLVFVFNQVTQENLFTVLFGLRRSHCPFFCI